MILSMHRKATVLFSRSLFLAVVMVLLGFSTTKGFAALGEPIGQVVLSKGVASARSNDRAVTALAKNSPVYVGDILETAARSFLVVQFSDGGKITLRPESRFDIDEYDDTPGKEKESFKLLKGGLRAVTGAIGKNRPQQVSFKAKNTTIGIRGTTFVVKLCESGMDGCTTTPGEELTKEQGEELVDIFVIDKNGGKKEKITRNNLQQILQGVYVAVEDGAIRFDLGGSFVDISKGDSCLADAGSVQCFSNGIDFSESDVYLTLGVEALTEFNIFDDSGLNAGGEICEID